MEEKPKRPTSAPWTIWTIPDKTELVHRYSKIMGNARWGYSKGEIDKEQVRREIRRAASLARMVPWAPPERNARGNDIYRDDLADEMVGIECEDRCNWSRYVYDQSEKMSGWQQYDTSQDASYFGVWVNTEKLQTFTFCEGDRTFVQCPDVEHLRAELEDMGRCYGPTPPAFVAFSVEPGTQNRVVDKTEIYDPRPTV